MNSRYPQFRARYPDAVFETRAVRCADETTRVLMMEDWYWRKLDLITSVDGAASLDEITDLCLRIAQQTHERIGQEFEEAFYELFMYYIWLNYHGYLQYRYGIANRFWPDIHQRERDWPVTLARSSERASD